MSYCGSIPLYPLPLCSFGGLTVVAGASQSVITTFGMFKEAQNGFKSSSVFRNTVFPLCITLSEKGNPQRYCMSCFLNSSCRGRKALLCANVCLGRSGKKSTCVPLKFKEPHSSYFLQNSFFILVFEYLTYDILWLF